MLFIGNYRGDLYSNLRKSDLYLRPALQLTFCWRLKPASKRYVREISWDAKRELQASEERLASGSPLANENKLSDYNGYWSTKCQGV